MKATLHYLAIVGLFAVGSLALRPADLSAATVTYAVDPHRSSLVLSLSFGGSYGWGQFTATGQVAGAMSACFEGSIVASASADGSLAFAGGSSIRALRNPNSPSTDPAAPSFHPTGSDPNRAWSGVDNFGVTCQLYDNAPLYVAYRGLVLDIPSGKASATGEAAAGMQLSFTGGQRDWSQPSILGVGDSQAPDGWPVSGGSNQSPAKVTLSADGSELTIPVVLTTRSFDLAGIVLFDEIWTGTIVARAGTGAVPEGPRMNLAASGPAGLQFNASGGTPTHYNGINTAPWVENSWVGAGSARYSFTITNGPGTGSSGFQAYAWWVANPTAYSTEEFSGAGNPHALRLVIESDGKGGASAQLGYRVNAPFDNASFSSRGLLAQIGESPFVGTWTVSVSGNVFTLTAPNGTESQGAMRAGDMSSFSEKVRLYFGVNPNGANNLNRYMTVGGIKIDVERSTGESTALAGDFTTGLPMHKNWTILAANPSGIFLIPPRSAWRVEWNHPGLGVPGIGTVEYLPSFLDDFGLPIAWLPLTLAATSSTLGNGRNVRFVPEADQLVSSGFFRISVP